MPVICHNCLPLIVGGLSEHDNDPCDGQLADGTLTCLTGQASPKGSYHTLPRCGRELKVCTASGEFVANASLDVKSREVSHYTNDVS